MSINPLGGFNYGRVFMVCVFVCGCGFRFHFWFLFQFDVDAVNIDEGAENANVRSTYLCLVGIVGCYPVTSSPIFSIALKKWFAQ